MNVMTEGMMTIIEMKEHVALHGFHLAWDEVYYCQETKREFPFLKNGDQGEAMWFEELDRVWGETDNSSYSYNEHAKVFIQAVLNDSVIDRLIKLKVFL